MTEGAELLDELMTALTTYVQFSSDEQVWAIALWTVASHAFAQDCFDTAPYLAVTSAERRSGKTRLIEVLTELVYDAWRISTAPTISSLFRMINKRRPTVLVDEVDELFASNGDDVKQVRAALNAGYRRGATVPRTEGDGNSREVIDYSVFSMKLLAGLRASRWPDTTLDRCIVIQMQRRHRQERVERFRHRHAAPALHEVRDQIETWAKQHAQALRQHEPSDLPQINDRAFEVWEPLLSVAAAIGGAWPERAVDAAVALSGGDDAHDDSIGVRLLADLRDVFDATATDGKLFSATAIEALNARDDAPWKNSRDGGIDRFRLGQLLKDYGIRTRTVWIEGQSAKGWERSDFQEAWQRYLPRTSLESVKSDKSDKSDKPVPPSPRPDASDGSDGFRGRNGQGAPAAPGTPPVHRSITEFMKFPAAGPEAK